MTLTEYNERLEGERKKAEIEKETKRRAEVMLATKFDDWGNPMNIEWRAFNCRDWMVSPHRVQRTLGNWTWNWQDYDYRIIEPAKPEYVPYDFSNAEEILGMKVKEAEGRKGFTVSIILGVSKDNRVAIINIHSGGSNTWEVYTSELLQDFTKLDGTPCGKLKT